MWTDKKTSLKYFLLIHLFFYFYIMRGNSMVNLLSRVFILYVLYRAFFPAKQAAGEGEESELVSEQTLKDLYVLLYIVLNKSIQFIRDIVQIKDGRSSIMVKFEF